MKIPKSIAVTLLLFVIAGSSHAGVYTLDYLVDAAVKRSCRLQSITKQMEQAELSLEMLYSSWFPRISFGMEFDHSFADYIPYRFRTVEGSGLPGGYSAAGRLEDIIEAAPNTVSAILSLRQPLFMQARTLPLLKAARAGQTMLLCSFAEERDRIRCETAKLYFRVLFEQQRTVICRERLLLAEETHRLTKINYSFDRAREFDTLNSLLRIEQALFESRLAERARRMAAESLIVCCGIAGAATEFRVDGEFPEPVFFMTVDEALAALHRDNHQLLQFQGSRTVHRERIALAKTGYLPVVYGGADIGRFGDFAAIPPPVVLRWGDDRRVYLGLGWDLFSGLSQQKIVRQRMLERDTLHLAQQKIIDDLELATRVAHDRVMSAMERLRALQTMVEIAQKSYGMAKKAYMLGSATSLELQNAEFDLGRAKLATTEGLFEFHTAVADFKFLIGSQ